MRWSITTGLDYSYDVYANLTTVSLDPGRPSCTWTTLNAGISTNNRITNTGFSYDAAGNVLSDGSFSYTWDAESQLKTAAGVTYTYDGDGRRVQKSNGKLYWYGAGGEVIAESDASGNFTDEYVFFGGKRIARRNVASGNVYYYFADHLGSSRVILQSGQSAPCYDADFDPFGGEHIVINTCPQNYKFTGKERDTETTLDYFGFRYYSSVLGRFHSADPSGHSARLINPQSWNRYAYALNNPLYFVDPNGLDSWVAVYRVATFFVGVYEQFARDYLEDAIMSLGASRFVRAAPVAEVGRVAIWGARPGEFRTIPTTSGFGLHATKGVGRYWLTKVAAWEVRVTFDVRKTKDPKTGQEHMTTTANITVLGNSDYQLSNYENPAMEHNLPFAIQDVENPTSPFGWEFDFSRLSPEQLAALAAEARSRGLLALAMAAEQELERRKEKPELKKPDPKKGADPPKSK